MPYETIFDKIVETRSKEAIITKLEEAETLSQYLRFAMAWAARIGSGVR